MRDGPRVLKGVVALDVARADLAVGKLRDREVIAIPGMVWQRERLSQVELAEVGKPIDDDLRDAGGVDEQVLEGEDEEVVGGGDPHHVGIVGREVAAKWSIMLW